MRGPSAIAVDSTVRVEGTGRDGHRSCDGVHAHDAAQGQGALDIGAAVAAAQSAAAEAGRLESESAGARIFEGSRVLSVIDGQQVTIRTTTGSVTAPTAFLACDAYMADLAPVAGRQTMPVLSYVIATEPLGAERAKALIPSNAAISDSLFVINYFRLSADNRLLFAGGEKYTPTPPRDITAFVRPYMLKLFPQLADARIDYAWGGAVGITINRLPHIGRNGNLLFAHGYSGQGVLLTTLVGELVAELLKGDSRNFDLFDKIPHHAFPGGKLLRSPIYVAAMLYSAMMDRL